MSKKKLKKNKELKNSTLAKVAFWFSVTAYGSLGLVVIYISLLWDYEIETTSMFYAFEYLHIILLWFLVGNVGALIMGIIALFQKDYRNTLAHISLVFGGLFLVCLFLFL